MTFLRPNFVPEPDEFWKSYRIQIDVLNECYNRRKNEAGDLVPIDPELDRLLDSAHGTSFQWLYAAEQRMAKLMPDEAILADAESKFADARKRELPSEPTLRAAFLATDDIKQKRAIHFVLMDDLQFFYLKRDRNRRARLSRARLLNILGATIILPTVVFCGIVYLRGNLAPLGHFHLFVILWFGLLGAYFSRMITFQRTYLSLDHEALLSEYSFGSILVRLIIGTMGSLMMYLFIRGELVGGELFPSWVDMTFIDRVNIDGGLDAVTREVTAPQTAQIVTDATATGASVTRDLAATADVVGQPIPVPPPTEGLERAPEKIAGEMTEGKSVLLVSKDYAQLLIWSALAGFSERLIPDRFATLERDANKTTA